MRWWREKKGKLNSACWRKEKGKRRTVLSEHWTSPSIERKKRIEVLVAVGGEKRAGSLKQATDIRLP